MPKWLFALVGLATVLMPPQAYAQAQIAGAKTQPETPSSDQKNAARAAFEAGFKLWQGGDFDAATLAFRQGLLIDPGNAAANYYIGDILVRKGDISAGCQAYAIAAISSNSTPEVFQARAALDKLTGGQSGNLAKCGKSYQWLKDKVSSEFLAAIQKSAWMTRWNSAAGWKTLSAERSETADSRVKNRYCNNLLLTPTRANTRSVSLTEIQLSVEEDNSYKADGKSVYVHCEDGPAEPVPNSLHYETWKPRLRSADSLDILGESLSWYSLEKYISNIVFHEDETPIAPGHEISLKYDEHSPFGEGFHVSRSCRVLETAKVGDAALAFPFEAVQLRCKHQLIKPSEKPDPPSERDMWLIPELSLDISPLFGFTDFWGGWSITETIKRKEAIDFTHPSSNVWIMTGNNTKLTSGPGGSSVSYLAEHFQIEGPP